MSMFTFTRRVDYGLAMLSILLERGSSGKVTLAELSEGGMPKAFMAQIAKGLVRNKILISREGRGGGYSFIREPKTISLKEALEAIGGEVMPTVCVSREARTCPLGKSCLQKGFMGELSEKVAGLLDTYKLTDITN